jgi:ankyrin repeat protein
MKINGIEIKNPHLSVRMMDCIFGGGSLEDIEEFIQQGADINVQDPVRRTPLMVCCEIGRYDLAKYFIDIGSDIHIYGEWCLQYSAHGGHLDIVKYLIKKGADHRTRDDIVLDYAAKKGQIEVVQYLISLGSPLEKLNKSSNEFIQKLIAARKLDEELNATLAINKDEKKAKDKI